jgi:succinate-acetate transporter protein
MLRAPRSKKFIWFLVASAFFASYTGAAVVVNSTWKRTVLPIGGEP